MNVHFEGKTESEQVRPAHALRVLAIPGVRCRWMSVPRILVVVFGLAWSAPMWAAERFPPPEFDTQHKMPPIQTPAPRAEMWGYVDVGILFLGLVLASLFVLKWRSSRALTWLGIGALLYFGFWRQGCVCAIGSIQNVSQAVFDPTYSTSFVVLAFFFLPLIFTVFFGRGFCAAVCPHGAIQDLVALKPIEIPVWLERGLRLFAYLYLGLAVLFAARGSFYLICRYDPFIALFRLTGDWSGTLLGVGFLAVGVFIGRPYCRFVCPYGVLLGLLGKVARRNVTITPDMCIECRLCEQSCPYNAIIPSSLESKKDTRVQDKRRLVYSLAALPMLIGALAWCGGQVGEVFARTHYSVDTAEQVYLQGEGLMDPVPDDKVAAFRGTGKSKKELYETAAAMRDRFVLGSWLVGAWMGLVVGLKLIGLAINRRRQDYRIDPEGCIACGRCYDLCSVEQVRVNLPDANADMKEILSASYAKEGSK